MTAINSEVDLTFLLVTKDQIDPLMQLTRHKLGLKCLKKKCSSIKYNVK